MKYINKVVQKIWEETSNKFRESYHEAEKKTAEELYQDLKATPMVFYEYQGIEERIGMNLVETRGCSWRIPDPEKPFSGCSMCDYQSEVVIGTQAKLEALRKKSSELYSKIVRQTFENVRSGSKPNNHELISGFNSFCDTEFPKQTRETVFLNLFDKPPQKYSTEVRAADVTAEKLRELRTYWGSSPEIEIEFGVEVGGMNYDKNNLGEWLRKYWINKGTSDKHIIEATNLIREAGYYSLGDVILGVPGLTEKQSKEVFIQTIRWVDDIGIDNYNFLPLNRKDMTLQGWIYSNLKDNERLKNLGLGGEHTGLNWLFTVVDSVYEVLIEKPERVDKLWAAQIFPDTNSITNIVPYNADPNCSCADDIRTVLDDCFIKRKIKDPIRELENLKDHIEKDPCKQKYDTLVEKQEAAGDILNTITILSEEIAKVMWPAEWEKQIAGLEREIKRV